MDAFGRNVGKALTVRREQCALPGRPSTAIATLICSLGLITGKPASAQEPVTPSGPAAPRPSRPAINLPLLASGKYIADVAVEVDPETNAVRLAKDDVERVLATVLSPEYMTALVATAADRDYYLAADFASIGSDLVYDPSTLELKLGLPTSSAQPGVISVSGLPSVMEGEDIVAPEGFSASLIVTATQSIDYERPGSPLQPLRGLLQGSAAIGGSKGVFLFSDLLYDGGAIKRFRRGQTVALYDDQPRAVRYYLGDLLPQVQGFQAAPLLGGFGFQRNYQELQPNRNIRPAGLFRFAVEEPSIVEIVVNGATVQVLRLERGQYDIRDFNFASGLNAVEIYARDDFGRRVLARFDQFFDFGLLAKGIDEFALFAGVRQRTSDAGLITYDTGRATVTGYYRRGLSQSMTAGIDMQAQQGRAMVGATVVSALPIGSFALLTGVSSDRIEGTGFRFLASYQGSFDRLAFIEQPSLNLEAGYTSSRFLPIGDTAFGNAISFDWRARFNGAIDERTNFGVAAAFSTLRNAPDTYLGSLTVSRSLGRFSLTATGEYARTIDGRTDRRALISLGASLGRRSSARASLDTRDQRAQFDFSRFRSDVLGDWGARAAIGRTTSRVEGSGEFAYNHNRALLTVDHAATSNGGLGQLRQRSSVTATTQVALAGGRIGFGRPVGPNFVLAYPHETLPSQVEIAQGVEVEQVQARSGVLGPALGTAGTAYAQRRVTLRAPDAPAGYDTGSGYYTLSPPAAGGYLLQVGSDASFSVIGTLQGPDGAPISLLAGTIRSLDRPESRGVPFFTNRSGRFVATGLVPGRHRLTLGQGAYYVDIFVTKEAQTSIELGIVRVSDGRGQ